VTAAKTAAPPGWADPAGAARHEQSRARYPDTADYLDRAGVRIYSEVYGTGEPDPGQRSWPAAFRSSNKSWSTGGTRGRSA
jgi:hypothetical protein